MREYSAPQPCHDSTTEPHAYGFCVVLQSVMLCPCFRSLMASRLVDGKKTSCFRARTKQIVDPLLYPCPI